MKSWYTLSEEEVLKELQTDRETGLSEAESAARLEKYGANELEGHKQESMLVRVLGQLSLNSAIPCGDCAERGKSDLGF